MDSPCWGLTALADRGKEDAYGNLVLRGCFY